ncbi:MAG TPA: hypothetical protein VIL97_06025 [Thermoanaerobaculia bacterium]
MANAIAATATRTARSPGSRDLGALSLAILRGRWEIVNLMLMESQPAPDRSPPCVRLSFVTGPHPIG